MIDDRRVLLVIQIDQDFERRLLAGESATVQAIADGRNSNTAGTALELCGHRSRFVQLATGGPLTAAADRR